MNLTLQNGFMGIDERADFKSNLGVASNILNFRITDSGSLTRRQGLNYLCYFENGDIDGIWSGNIGSENFVLVASGGYLFKITPNSTDVTPISLGYIGTGECMMFEFGGLLYIKTDKNYSKFDGSLLSAAEGYIPTVALSCSPNGEGEIFEQINLLTPKRRQLFSSDGSALVYTLAENEIDSVDAILVNGKKYVDKYSVDKALGKISLIVAPEEGLNNVEIIYSKAHSESDLSRIFGCNKMMLFGGNSDGRVFLWGNPNFPNYRFHSDLAKGIPSAEYFPVNGFTIIGNSKINCIVQQYDKQLIFTENEAFYSYCELKEDSLGNIYSSFPVFSLNNGKGCIFETKGCVMDNKPVTLCLDGLNLWESTSVQNEKNAQCFSMAVNKTVSEIIGSDKKNMAMFDFQANRELYFIYGETALIYNYGNGAWYKFDDFGGKHFSVFERVVYFARGDVLYMYGNDADADLERVCVWETPFITSGQSFGRSDLVSFAADAYVEGNSNLRFEFKKSGTDLCVAREISLNEENGRFLRIALRPSLKRAMPFKIVFTDNGPGKCVLHNITIKTREKERSSRDGIL